MERETKLNSCKGAKWGHHFAGNICLYCGIQQSDLNLKFWKKKSVKQWQPPKENKNLHSELHCVVDELYRYFGVKGQFGILLGVVKKIGRQKAFQFMAEMKQDGNKEIKLFMWKVKQWNQQ